MSSTSHSRKSKLATSVARVMYTNAVYFPNNRVYQGHTPAMLNYSCINRVYYAYASIAPDGSVFLGDEWADTRAQVDGVHGALGSLIYLKRCHAHLEVVLSIGGAGASDMFPVVAGSHLLRDNFARSAMGLVDASGLDGLDISWEYPSNPQQAYDFLALLATIRGHFPGDRYILSAALPADKAVLQLIDLKEAARHLDYINLVAYDFFGTWTSNSGHHAQLYAMAKDETSASSGVGYLMSHGFPADGILLGIPTHGHSFLHATGPGQALKDRGEYDGTCEYHNLPRKGSKETVDKRRIAAQCTASDVGFITYDNPETVKVKAAFVKQKGLGGLFYSNGATDSNEKSRSLAAAGFRALHTS